MTALHLGQSTVGAESLALALACRHGLITGATGTGKTVSLQVLAEGFSAAGVPVFAADIKGDLSGIAQAGQAGGPIGARADRAGVSLHVPRSFPVTLWDIFGQEGHPVRATVEDMGPLLLSRLLDLTNVQEGCLNIVFKVWADRRRRYGGHRLLTLANLREAVGMVQSKAKDYRVKYGNIAPSSIGAIQRGLLVLEQQGASQFFGTPALDIRDFLRTDLDGRGVINILDATLLMETPQLYGTFMLWLLTKLWQQLPEVGDLDKPKLVFFFDEAHILFNEAPDALLQQIERVTRLVRSKGVGVYYATQNPRDVPDRISAQLGNRVQHALRAFTPLEMRGVKAAAQTFRPNPAMDTQRAILELGVGDALVSTLSADGTPSIVQRTTMRPPQGRMGPLTADERQQIIRASPLFGKYDARTDLESDEHADAKQHAVNDEAPPTWTGPTQWTPAGGDDRRAGRLAQVVDAAPSDTPAACNFRRDLEAFNERLKAAAKAGAIGEVIGSAAGKSHGGIFGALIGAVLGTSKKGKTNGFW